MICACGVVVVHPDDSRYTNYVGKKVRLPIAVSGRTKEVEIKSHRSVKMEFGTGVLMVCSFGDQNDVSVFRELGLEPYVAIDLDGRMTEISGPLSGKTVEEARDEAISILNDSGLLKSVEEKEQEVPVSERGGNPVEIILLKEWYVKQTHIQDRLRQLSNQSNFIPERNRQFLHDWMDGVSIDWPISRRRWYHTEVPIWYSQDGNKIVVPPSGTYVQPWREGPPPGSEVIDRESKTLIGKYSEMLSDLGKLQGRKGLRYLDGLSNSNLYVSGYLTTVNYSRGHSQLHQTSRKRNCKDLVVLYLTKKCTTLRQADLKTSGLMD